MKDTRDHQSLVLLPVPHWLDNSASRTSLLGPMVDLLDWVPCSGPGFAILQSHRVDTMKKSQLGFKRTSLLPCIPVLSDVGRGTGCIAVPSGGKACFPIVNAAESGSGHSLHTLVKVSLRWLPLTCCLASAEVGVPLPNESHGPSKALWMPSGS
jgi:hypothetical protein